MTAIGQMMQKARFVLRVEARRGSALMRECEREAQNRQQMTKGDVEQVRRSNNVPTYTLTRMTGGVTARMTVELNNVERMSKIVL